MFLDFHDKCQPDTKVTESHPVQCKLIALVLTEVIFYSNRIS